MRRAQVNGFANREAVEAYLAAIKRLTDYSVKYDTALRDYLYANRGTAGFTPPAYEGGGTATTDGSTGSLTTSSSDLDDILNS